jgi:hypothetical protein
MSMLTLLRERLDDGHELVFGELLLNDLPLVRPCFLEPGTGLFVVWDHVSNRILTRERPGGDRDVIEDDRAEQAADLPGSSEHEKRRRGNLWFGSAL